MFWRSVRGYAVQHILRENHSFIKSKTQSRGVIPILCVFASLRYHSSCQENKLLQDCSAEPAETNTWRRKPSTGFLTQCRMTEGMRFVHNTLTSTASRRSLHCNPVTTCFPGKKKGSRKGAKAQSGGAIPILCVFDFMKEWFSRRIC